jgi:ferredoxin
MDTIKIYYFSGTGNAKNIAVWFAEIAVKKGVDVQLYNIANIGQCATETISSEALIVFIAPIHGFNYPPVMLKFINHFSQGNNRVVLLSTQGSVKIGKIFVPGLSGIAFMWASFVLRKKGYQIIGQVPFDMPVNWISVHPALTAKAVKFLHEKSRKKLEKHVEIILSGKPDFLARRDLPFNILVSPIALAYYFGGRFFLAKSYFASNACNKCGICEKECPVQAIKNSDILPFWTYRCESCMRCMNTCPKQAIEAAHGLWAVLIIASSLLSGIFCTTINLNNLTGGVKFLIFNVVFFVLLFVFYRIHHILLKIKIFRKLVTWTSLTHYKFWGRYFSENHF